MAKLEESENIFLKYLSKPYETMFDMHVYATDPKNALKPIPHIENKSTIDDVAGSENNAYDEIKTGDNTYVGLNILNKLREIKDGVPQLAESKETLDEAIQKKTSWDNIAKEASKYTGIPMIITKVEDSSKEKDEQTSYLNVFLEARSTKGLKMGTMTVHIDAIYEKFNTFKANNYGVFKMDDVANMVMKTFKNNMKKVDTDK